MKAKAFTEKHFGIFKEWWTSRGLSAQITMENLPQSGWMIMDEDEPVLAGFVILTNARFAMIEGICAKPGLSREKVDAALAVVIDHSMQVAGKLGFKSIMAFPQQESLVNVAKSHGFVVDPRLCTLVVKEL